MDADKAKALAANTKELLELYKKQAETTRQLLRVCLKHLKDRRRFIPNETWEEREELVEALEKLTGVNNG